MVERSGRARTPVLIGVAGAIILVLAAVIVVSSIGPLGSSPVAESTPIRSDEPTAPAPSEAGSDPPRSQPANEDELPCADWTAPAEDPDAVLVYFTCEPAPAEPRPVARETGGIGSADGRLRFAIEQLLAGPSAPETRSGFSSVFPSDSEHLLLDVEVLPDGTAIIDLDDDLLRIGPLNASAMRFLVFGSLGATAFQFDQVWMIEFRIQGSCETFASYFESSCDNRIQRPSPGPRDDQVLGTWVLIEGAVDGTPILIDDGPPVTLVLSASDVRGQAPCNVFGAPIVLDGRALAVGPMSSSEAGCASGQDEAVERAVLQAVAGATSALIEDNRLLLRGPGVELRFVAIVLLD